MTEFGLTDEDIRKMRPTKKNKEDRPRFHSESDDEKTYTVAHEIGAFCSMYLSSLDGMQPIKNCHTFKDCQTSTRVSSYTATLDLVNKPSKKAFIETLLYLLYMIQMEVIEKHAGDRDMLARKCLALDIFFQGIYSDPDTVFEMCKERIGIAKNIERSTQ